MTFLLLWAGAVVTAPPPAQPAVDAVERALAAAPAQMRERATVIEWNRDFTYRTLKQGSKRLVCFELSGQPGQDQPFVSECTSSGNLERVAQDLAFAATGDQQTLVDRAERTGKRAQPEYRSRLYRAAGPDPSHTRKTVSLFVHPEPPIERRVLTPPTPPGLRP